MQKLDCFSNSEKADIKRLLKLKTKSVEGGHQIYKVMPSRDYRLTPDQSFKQKFYPVWALLEAVGAISAPRLDDAGEDTLMISTCGVKHCVAPEHLEWAMKGRYRASFQKDLFDHPSTVWTPELVEELKELKKDGSLSYLVIGKKLGVSHTTVGYACRHLGI